MGCQELLAVSDGLVTCVCVAVLLLPDRLWRRAATSASQVCKTQRHLHINFSTWHKKNTDWWDECRPALAALGQYYQVGHCKQWRLQDVICCSHGNQDVMHSVGSSRDNMHTPFVAQVLGLSCDVVQDDSEQRCANLPGWSTDMTAASLLLCTAGNQATMATPVVQGDTGKARHLTLRGSVPSHTRWVSQ